MWGKKLKKSRRILVSEEVLKLLAEGKVKQVEGVKIRLGRWVIKERRGIFIGSKSQGKSKP